MTAPDPQPRPTAAAAGRPADAPPGPGPRAEPSPTHPAPPTRRWNSTDLFGPARDVEIVHGGAVYRLRLTSLNKLILTK